jgi:hypothetical protein
LTSTPFPLGFATKKKSTTIINKITFFKTPDISTLSKYSKIPLYSNSKNKFGTSKKIPLIFAPTTKKKKCSTQPYICAAVCAPGLEGTDVIFVCKEEIKQTQIAKAPPKEGLFQFAENSLQKAERCTKCFCIEREKHSKPSPFVTLELYFDDLVINKMNCEHSIHRPYKATLRGLCARLYCLCGKKKI